MAIATIIARGLGLLQRVPLEHMLDEGNVAFGISQNVYLAMLTIATAGIPSTLSKMVSERYTLNKVYEAERIYYAALLLGIISGFMMTSLLMAFAGVYANMIKVPEATLAIRALAPALLLFPVIAMMRGYMQGRNTMQASGISQIIEQILRVATAISFAYVLMVMGQKPGVIAAGASFGGVIGSVGAFIMMVYYMRKLRQADREAGLRVRCKGEPKIALRTIFRAIFALSIPIVISSLAVPAVNVIDTSITVPLLSPGSSLLEAKYLGGILSQRAQSIAGIPPILAIALSVSLIPVISSSFARRDMRHLQHQITLSIRLSVLSGMPIVLALSVAAYAVNGCLFSTLDGAGIIAMLTLGTIFQITMMTSISILIGLGKSYIPMISVIFGMIIKMMGSYLLAPWLGMYGILLGTILNFLVVTWLNLRVIKKVVPFSVLGQRWGGFLLTIALSGGIGYSFEWLGERIWKYIPLKITLLFTAFTVACVVIMLFVVGLVVFRVIRQHELPDYPRTIQNLLRPLMRWQV